MIQKKPSQTPCFLTNYSVNSLCGHLLPRSSFLWAGSSFWLLLVSHFHHTMAEPCALWIWLFRVSIHTKTWLTSSPEASWHLFCWSLSLLLVQDSQNLSEGQCPNLFHSSVIQVLHLCLKQLKKERSGFLEGFAFGISFIEQSNSERVLSTDHCQGWPKMWFQWRHVLTYFSNVFVM